MAKAKAETPKKTRTRPEVPTKFTADSYSEWSDDMVSLVLQQWKQLAYYYSCYTGYHNEHFVTAVTDIKQRKWKSSREQLAAWENLATVAVPDLRRQERRKQATSNPWCSTAQDYLNNAERLLRRENQLRCLSITIRLVDVEIPFTRSPGSDLRDMFTVSVTNKEGRKLVDEKRPFGVSEYSQGYFK